MNGMLFVAAEGLPFVKTGGLADVIGSLPKALTHEGFNVSVIMPLYLKTAKKDREHFTKLTTLTINVGVYHQVKTAIYQTEVKGITYYFVEHAGYFEREGYYGYPDDGERFAFFNHAVMHLLETGLIDIDVVHCHDWHTGLVPLLAKTLYIHRVKPMLSIYTIHNLAFQGNFPYGMLESCIGLPNHYYFDGSLRFKDGISFMKAGILYADLVTTVSDTYAKEILTPEFGEHMEDILRLRQKDLYGIVNGIDVEDWDPATDPHLVANYTTKNVAKGKLANKLAIQRELGLRQDPNVMLVAMVSRLTDQKGIWLLLQSLNTIMGWDLQLIILGTGDSHVEGQLKPIEFRYPHRAVFYCGYNEALAHRIYAGADVFLMPSLFEPCGISQQIAMRYGTLPLARETGGLKDTVEPYNQHTLKGTGFTFGPFSVEDFKHVLWLAYETYTFRQDHFKAMIKHAMKKDLSWDKSAKLYTKLIHKRIQSK